MPATIAENIQAWKAIATTDYPDPSQKTKFHKLSQTILSQLANGLKLNSRNYAIRSNFGGHGVWGEIVLHAEHIYIMIAEPPYLGDPKPQEVMYRTCQGREDYVGGANQWCRIDDLQSGETLNKILKIAHGE